MEDRLFKVKQFYKTHTRLPSYSEMCKLFNLASKDNINKIVTRWISDGIFQKINGKITPARSFFNIPVLGSIQAGIPFSEEEIQNESISIADWICMPGVNYILKVSGDSMQEAGIINGDLVIIDKNISPKEGDIVAAFVDEKWTLKYFSKKNGKIILLAANNKYKSIYPKNELIIGGVVTKVIRKYY